MKVLIAGKNGQLGWELSRTQPDSVTETSFNSSEELNITDRQAVAEKIAAFAPDVVINAAAYTAVDKAETDSEAAYAVNEQGVINLAEACKGAGAKLIHVSTDFVFDAKKNTPYKPADQTAPLGVYGASKLAGEQALKKILPADSSIVRTAWVYSVHGNNFVKTMLRLMAEKEQLGVVFDQVGTPTNAKGLAQALWKLAENMVAPESEVQPVYHWTDLGVASWYDFAVAIQSIACELNLLDKKIPVNPIFASQYPTPAKRPAYSVLDTLELREYTGISGIHWRESLFNMLKEIQA